LTLADLNLPGVTKEVRELQAADTARIIEGIFADVVGTILAGDGFSYAVPDRSAANHMYVEALDRIVLKDRVSQRAFANASTVRKAAITTRVMQLVHQLLRKNIHTSKRDIFYADPNLFSAQEESDAVLNDIACIVGCTRTSLAIVASDKVRAHGEVVRCQWPSWCTVFFFGGGGDGIVCFVCGHSAWCMVGTFGCLPAGPKLTCRCSLLRGCAPGHAFCCFPRLASHRAWSLGG